MHSSVDSKYASQTHSLKRKGRVHAADLGSGAATPFNRELARTLRQELQMAPTTSVPLVTTEDSACVDSAFHRVTGAGT